MHDSFISVISSAQREILYSRWPTKKDFSLGLEMTIATARFLGSFPPKVAVSVRAFPHTFSGNPGEIQTGPAIKMFG